MRYSILPAELTYYNDVAGMNFSYENPAFDPDTWTALNRALCACFNTAAACRNPNMPPYLLPGTTMVLAHTDAAARDVVGTALYTTCGSCAGVPSYVDDDDAFVYDVCTRPEYRGRGVARRLMTDAMRAARDGGARRVFLTVDPANATAIGLYASLGFRRAPQQNRGNDGKLYDVMEARL